MGVDEPVPSVGIDGGYVVEQPGLVPFRYERMFCQELRASKKPPNPRLCERPPDYVLRPDAREEQCDALLLARLIRRRAARCACLLQRADPGTGRALEHGAGDRAAERAAAAVGHPADVADRLLGAVPLEQERFLVVALTTRRAVIAVETLYVGTIDTILIRPAEVFRSAIRVNAAVLVVAHSEPSGGRRPRMCG